MSTRDWWPEQGGALVRPGFVRSLKYDVPHRCSYPYPERPRLNGSHPMGIISRSAKPSPTMNFELVQITLHTDHEGWEFVQRVGHSCLSMPTVTLFVRLAIPYAPESLQDFD